MLLENEFNKSVVEENMAKLLNACEKLRSEETLLLTNLLTNKIQGISYEEVDKELPFTIDEIRHIFPLSIANPIIYSNPDDVVSEVEGKGKPVCKNFDFMFFASYRDFENYFLTDEFKDASFPENKYQIILLPEEEFNRYENAKENTTSKNVQIMKWLIDNGKLKVVKIPTPVKLFLLSLYGYANKIPFDIAMIKNTILSKQEILLKKKFELYYKGLEEILEDNKPIPKIFFGKKQIKGLNDIWGVNQLKEKEVAVAGLALAFYKVSPTDKDNLISIRDLFRTKDHRGPLADVKVGRGLPTLADDLLPRKDKGGQIVDAPSVDNLKDYWSKDEKEKLEILARLLELSEFEKLSDSDDYRRILEAFWKAIRDEFDDRNIQDLKRRIRELIKKLDFIQKVEKDCQKDLGLKILFEDTQENIINALDGLKKLIDISFADKLPNFILKMYLEAILDKVENVILNLHSEVQKVNEKMDELKKNGSKIIDYLKDKKEILTFLGNVSFDKVKKDLNELFKINNEYNLSDGTQEIVNRIRYFEIIFTNFAELEKRLMELKQKLSEHCLWG